MVTLQLQIVAFTCPPKLDCSGIARFFIGHLAESQANINLPADIAFQIFIILRNYIHIQFHPINFPHFSVENLILKILKFRKS